jgi:hypothetical protein
MDGGVPEVDRVAELSCWTIAELLIERQISTDMSALRMESDDLR